MLAMLLAYNAAGEVIATLDHLVARDENGEVIGLIDFAEHEQTGGELLDIWNVPSAVGSGTWPEWIGARAHNFKVELDGKRIKALIHARTTLADGTTGPGSGHRRERAAIEAAVAERILVANGEPADLRDLLGGPSRPLVLDDEGRTQQRVEVERPALPLIRAEPPRPQ